MENALRSGGGLGVRKFGGAVGAKLVGVGDFALALRAGGMEIAFAVGAEIEPGGNGCGALRASVGQRLANQQVDDQADEEVCRRKDQDQQGPQARVHATSLGVAINVAERKNENREKGRHEGDYPCKPQAGENRITAQGIVREDGIAGMHVVEIDASADDQRQDVKSDTRPHEPLGENAEFFAKGGAFALPAKANHAQTLVPGIRHTVFLSSRKPRKNRKLNPLGSRAHSPLVENRSHRAPSSQLAAVTAQSQKLPLEAADASCARSRTRSCVRAARSRGTLTGTARNARKAFCVALASCAQAGHSAKCSRSQVSSAGRKPSTTDSARRRCARICKL